ncbi:MAG: hypothetical protein GY913_34745 [Proteobacteria bacterium]|nr:hypothetical protein [Pseudomonadota bacterium]MCP4922088.1 hypothetical protein [Pseudomonadota bacterium]
MRWHTAEIPRHPMRVQAVREAVVVGLPVDALADVRRPDVTDDQWARMMPRLRRDAVLRAGRLHRSAQRLVSNTGRRIWSRDRMYARRPWEPHQVRLRAHIVPFEDFRLIAQGTRLGSADRGLALVGELRDLTYTEIQGATAHQLVLLGEPRDGAFHALLGWIGDLGGLVHGRRRHGLPLLPARVWRTTNRDETCLVAAGQPLARWKGVWRSPNRDWADVAPSLGLDPSVLRLQGRMAFELPGPRLVRSARGQLKVRSDHPVWQVQGEPSAIWETDAQLDLPPFRSPGG